MKWILLFFCSFAFAGDPDFSGFSGSFLMKPSQNRCTSKAEVLFDGKKMAMFYMCENNTYPYVQAYFCESDGRAPKCKTDTSMPPKDCDKNEIQFFSSGNFLVANPCQKETFLFIRDPSQPAPSIKESKFLQEANSQNKQQNETRPEKERFD
ncbi:MAG: hypothetical protein A4S09_13620 [Proteobacteria bacterium SG_bin7]|nr:MAG: hypothetical protein A4S09_13620 [Proteobacteria bacterium SG_bin7]